MTEALCADLRAAAAGLRLPGVRGVSGVGLIGGGAAVLDECRKCWPEEAS